MGERPALASRCPKQIYHKTQNTYLIRVCVPEALISELLRSIIPVTYSVLKRICPGQRCHILRLGFRYLLSENGSHFVCEIFEQLDQGPGSDMMFSNLCLISTLLFFSLGSLVHQVCIARCDICILHGGRGKHVAAAHVMEIQEMTLLRAQTVTKTIKTISDNAKEKNTARQFQIYCGVIARPCKYYIRRSGRTSPCLIEHCTKPLAPSVRTMLLRINRPNVRNNERQNALKLVQKVGLNTFWR